MRSQEFPILQSIEVLTMCLQIAESSNMNDKVNRGAGWIGRATAALALLVALTGCSTKNDLNATQPFILITPSIANGIDLGQSVNMTASVIGDNTNAGVTWATCTTQGTLTNVTKFGATYTAPPADPTLPPPTTNGCIAVTAIAFPTFSVTFTLNLNIPPIVGNNASNIQGVTSAACAGNTKVQNPALYIGYNQSISLNTTYTANNNTNQTSGTSPFTWAVTSGSLPPGLGLYSNSNALQGNVTTPGAYNFTLSVTDSAATPQSASSALTVNVSQAPPLTYYAGPPLPLGTTTLGSPIVTFPNNLNTTSINNGLINCLRVGYAISGPGIPSGTTVSAVTSTSVGGKLTLSAPATASGVATLVTANPNAGTLPNANQGVNYSTTLQTLGGGGEVFWSVAKGYTLPAGLSVVTTNATNNGGGWNAISTGSITGTPTIPGTYTFSLQAVDSAPGAYQQTMVQPFTLTVLPTPTLTVTTGSVLNAYLAVPFNQLLTSSGGVAPYTWAVTGGTLPPGLKLSSLGTFSGTPTALGSSTVTVTVTDNSSPALTASKQLTINVVPAPLVITTTSVSSASENAPYYQALHAAGGTPPITWSINSGALPSGLTLSSTGVISGKATALGKFGITVQAQDSSTPTPQTANQMLTIVVNPPNTGVNNNELKGSYAFLTKGFDSTGNPLTTLGSFTADGNGNITGGSEDIAGASVQSNLPITGGSYLIDGDNRGTVSLTTSLDTSTFSVALDSLSSAIAGAGRIASFDPASRQLTGSFYLQDATSFSVGALKAGYSFGLSGFSSPTTRAAMIGEVQLDGAGNIASGLEDSNIGGTSAASVSIGPGSSYTVSNTGRGTETFSTGSTSIPLVFYVVSANRLLVASTGAISSGNPLLSGQQFKQTVSSFGNATLKGSYVIREEKLTGSTADVQVGLIGFDSAGAINLFSTDENSNGVVTSNALPAAGAAYTVATTGRTVITGGSLTGTLYLVGPSQGFLIDSSSAVGFGSIDLQVGSNFAAASLVGKFALGTADPLAAAVGVGSGVFTADGVSVLTDTLDTNVGGNLSAAQVVTGTYTMSTTGRGVFIPAGSPTGSPGTAIYLVSPTQAVLLDLTVTAPSIQSALHQ